jgi:ubiquinone/menaquinone biosynthesis C-methylase UbiE
MNKTLTYQQAENAAAAAFDRQAPIFDEIYSNDLIIQYKRKRVREHVLKFLQPQSEILELNAGTGEDALFFAQHGHKVHATDISTAMQAALRTKMEANNAQDLVSTELVSFTHLDQLSNRGPYDLVFSNFAGLNCTAQLEQVLLSLPPLVKPNGHITLVILPAFCLWESLLAFRGKFKTAFRRMAGSKGASAHIEGEHFRAWYYNPGFVRRTLRQDCHLVGLEGLCTLVPPSYINQFGEKYPRSFRFLQKLEDRWKSGWLWRNIGDYYIITLQKKH